MPGELLKRVKRGFNAQGFMHTLGAELVHAAPGECTIRLRYSEALSQQHGFFHGGVTGALADNAAGFASYTLMEEGEQPLTIEFKVSLLAAAQGEFLEARARVLRAGRRIKFAQTDVYSLDGKDEHHVATALVTVATSKSVQELPAEGPE